MHKVPDQPSITIVKRFTYRGALEEFSNTYHFSGTTPATAAAWKTLADAMIAAEAPTVPADVGFVNAYGYEAGNDHSVAQIDYRIAPNTVVTGSFSLGAASLAPGDVAATTRWPTPDLTSRGKRIYLRKFWHCVAVAGPAASDNLLGTQRTALNTFAAKLIDGTLPGSFKYCGPQGAVAGVGVTSVYLTTRTLKRRGKRPPTT